MGYTQNYKRRFIRLSLQNWRLHSPRMDVCSRQEPKRSLAVQSKKLEALAEEGQIKRERLRSSGECWWEILLSSEEGGN